MGEFSSPYKEAGIEARSGVRKKRDKMSVPNYKECARSRKKKGRKVFASKDKN